MISPRLAGIAFKDKVRAPMQTLQTARITIAEGLVGDARGKLAGRQVSILFAEDWAAACAELGESRPWTIRRANLLVEGLVNPKRAGDVLLIGAARLEITDETDPCSRMEAQWAGLKAALVPDWRGGLLARVLAGGDIAVGDAVMWADG